MRRLAPLVAAFVLFAGTRADAGTSIAPLVAESPVRVWADISLLSIREPGGMYRLATQQGTEAPRPLAGIAAARRPFVANIGPGPAGSPVIVFVRCRSPRHCKLFRTTGAGTVETPIASAVPNGRMRATAVWGDRLAVVRESSSGINWLYVTALEGGKRAHIERLQSAPRPACESGLAELGFDFQCLTSEFHPTVMDLSLRGTTLAETVSLGLVESFDLCPRTEVRVVDLADRRGRRVAYTDCGLSGSGFVAASLTRGHLLYARTCPGDENGCNQEPTVLYRYNLSDHRTEWTRLSELLIGFAAEDDRDIVAVAAPGAQDGQCPHANETGGVQPCELERIGPLPFKPAKRRKRA